MADNANDLKRRTAHHVYPDMLAHHIPTAESMSSEILVDNDHRLAAFAIVVVEKASRDQLDPHHLQVVWRHAGGDRDRLLANRQRIRGGPVRPHVHSFAHRNDVGKSGKLHLWQAPGTLEHIPPGGPDLRWIVKHVR